MRVSHGQDAMSTNALVLGEIVLKLLKGRGSHLKMTLYHLILLGRSVTGGLGELVAESVVLLLLLLGLLLEGVCS